jgi:hypothetical protein
MADWHEGQEGPEGQEGMKGQEGLEGQEGPEGPDGRDEMPRRASAELKAILEALIFASPEPLTPKAIFKLLATEPREDIQAALALLKQEYERPGGLQLVEVAGGYQIVTRPDLHDCGGSSTNARRRSRRCRRSRRWPSSPTAADHRRRDY